MPEYLNPQLPLGLDEHQLRFVRLIPGRPAGFEESAIEHGWRPRIKEGIGGNRYKVNYRLSRLAPEFFDDGDVEEVKDDIGIIDEYGLQSVGYDVWVENVKLIVKAPEYLGGFNQRETRILNFEFEGFPTDETMDVMQNLMTYFEDSEDAAWLEVEQALPESRIDRIRKWLGKLITGDTELEPPN